MQQGSYRHNVPGTYDCGEPPPASQRGPQIHIRICVYKINIRSEHVRMTCPLTVIIVFPKRLMYCFRRDMYIIELDHGDVTCAVTK